jgi:hypothetical protein
MSAGSTRIWGDRCHHAAVEAFRFLGTSRGEGSQHLGQARWLEQLLDQMVSDEGVECRPIICDAAPL